RCLTPLSSVAITPGGITRPPMLGKSKIGPGKGAMTPAAGGAPALLANRFTGGRGPRVELAGKDGATKIVGSAFDLQFKDMAPDGGLLIGFEFGLENNNAIKAIRPLYRNDKNQEVKG